MIIICTIVTTFSVAVAVQKQPCEDSLWTTQCSVYNFKERLEAGRLSAKNLHYFYINYTFQHTVIMYRM